MFKSKTKNYNEKLSKLTLSMNQVHVTGVRFWINFGNFVLQTRNYKIFQPNSAKMKVSNTNKKEKQRKGKERK